MALARSGAGASGVVARLRALRSAERCARFLTVAARVFRMFFLADAIFGTEILCSDFGRKAIDEDPES